MLSYVRRSLVLSSLTFCALTTAGAAYGQSDTAADSNRGSAATTARDNRGFNPGWLGLIGLAGLAGLMGRNDRATSHSSRFESMTPTASGRG